MDAIFFYFFALLVLGGAILTITRRSAIHSAICLIISLIGVAGLYLMQKAEFLFAVQIILYIGGIMVLFLFVIMLVNLDAQARERQFNGQWWIALACVAVVSAQAFYFLRQRAAAFQLAKPVDALAPSRGQTEMIADVLFSAYMLPVELASLLQRVPEV